MLIKLKRCEEPSQSTGSNLDITPPEEYFFMKRLFLPFNLMMMLAFDNSTVGRVQQFLNLINKGNRVTSPGFI